MHGGPLGEGLAGGAEDAAGTIGAEATKAMMVGVTFCHVPATGGVSVGTGEWAATGTENCTVKVASLGTLDAPSTGLTATIFRGSLDVPGRLVGVVVGEADTLPPLVWPTTVTPMAPTTRTTPTTIATTCRRPWAVDCLCAGEWAPDIVRSPLNLPGDPAIEHHGAINITAIE